MQAQEEMFESRKLTRRAVVKTALGAAATVVGGPLLRQVARAQQRVSEVKIGALWAHTGAAAAFARIPLMVQEMFLEEFNSGLGIRSLGGAKLNFINMDTQSNPDLAVSQLNRLAREGISMVIGTGQSAAGALVSMTAERLRIPVILPVDKAANLTERGLRYVFRICPTTDDYGIVAVQFLDELNKISPIRRVAIMNQDDVWGSGGGDVMEREAPKRGYEVVRRVTYSSSQQDFRSVLASFRDAGVDAMLFASYPNDAVLITRQMREVQFNPKAMVAVGGGHKEWEYIRALGPLADYVFSAVGPLPDAPIKPLQEFNERFRARYGEDLDENGGFMLSALWTIVDALERAGTTDPVKLRDALATTNLKVGESNVVTIPGVRFNEKGQNEVQVTMLQILEGRQRTVYPREFASAELVYPKPPWP